MPRGTMMENWPVLEPGDPCHAAPMWVQVSAFPQSKTNDGSRGDGWNDPIKFSDFVREEGCPIHLLSESVKQLGIESRKGWYEYDELEIAWERARPPEGLVSAARLRVLLGSKHRALEGLEPAWSFGRHDYYRPEDVAAARARVSLANETAKREAAEARHRISAFEQERRRAQAKETEKHEKQARTAAALKARVAKPRAAPKRKVIVKKEKAAKPIAVPAKGFYTATEAAKELGITVGTLYQALHKGHLHSSMSPTRRLLITAAALGDYREKHQGERHPRRPARKKAPSITVYVAGPISGRLNDNREAFERARAELEANPAVQAVIPHDLFTPGAFAKRCPALLWCQAMLLCLPMVETADYVYLLEGWERSRGASREASLARERGKECVFQVPA